MRAPDVGNGAPGAEAGGEPTVAGKRSLVARRYPALGRALTAEEPTIHDAATAAVEHKDGGSAVDATVATQVGAHLGADLHGVRVHQDPLAQEATAAMGARAFAHGSDVFLGAGEHGGDLGLMAHELTHVVQQGAAGQRLPQRQVQVGAGDSPAEHQADQVAAAVTGGQAPATLLVDDGPVAAGQMLKSQFLDQLRGQVMTVADAELGPIYAGLGCPTIDDYFSRYATQPAAAAEALLRRFAPASRAARTAAEVIPAVVARVREGIRTWRDTGQTPPELAAEGVTPAAAPAQPGAETLGSLEAELGPGQPVDGGVASRMSDALGVDVSGVRVHTGPVAARKADAAGAVAFAVGDNIVMGAGAPAAGTLEGDALLAHELAHTAQQAGAAADPIARRQPIGGESAAAEAQADEAALGALAQLHGEPRGLAHLAAKLGGALRTGLQLQRCPSVTARQTPQRQPQPGPQPQPQPAPPAPPAPGVALASELQTVIDGATWRAIRVTAYPAESAAGIQRAHDRHTGALPDLTGLGAIVVLDRFAAEIHRIQGIWTTLTPDQRKDQVGAAGSAELVRAQVPGFLDVQPIQTEFKGSFDPRHWKFNISQDLIDAGTLPDREAGELCNTALHESRHAEQQFLAARFQAEQGANAAQVAATVRIPQVIADDAHRRRLTGAPQAVRDLAQRMNQAMVTNRVANNRISNDDGLANLATRRTEAQAALAALRASATGATIAAAEHARDALNAQIAEVRRLYTLYRNIPYEADAHEVGDAAEQAFKGWP